MWENDLDGINLGVHGKIILKNMEWGCRLGEIDTCGPKMDVCENSEYISS